ncbi:hypothetical protein JL720_3138 [Aureococcus anophagefferens]|nr:hypothetical protein JL720_3138 [Aureococcus anophagefferens]
MLADVWVIGTLEVVYSFVTYTTDGGTCGDTQYGCPSTACDGDDMPWCTAIEDDAWSIRGDDYFWQNFQHYCHTYDGTDWKFYFNGALAHTETVALDTGSDNPLTIGVRYSSGYSGYFNGKIDDVYVYSSALNAASIQVLYNDGAR